MVFRSSHSAGIFNDLLNGLDSYVILVAVLVYWDIYAKYQPPQLNNKIILLFFLNNHISNVRFKSEV